MINCIGYHDDREHGGYYDLLFGTDILDLRLTKYEDDPNTIYLRYDDEDGEDAGFPVSEKVISNVVSYMKDNFDIIQPAEVIKEFYNKDYKYESEN